MNAELKDLELETVNAGGNKAAALASAARALANANDGTNDGPTTLFGPALVAF